MIHSCTGPFKLTLSNGKELRTIRDKVTGCEAALKATERQLSDLEASVPRARMEAEAEQAKAVDIQQRLDELRAATEVRRTRVTPPKALKSLPYKSLI